MELNKITEKIIGCAIEVHKTLGPGLLESVYEECLAYELELSGLFFERQLPIDVVYKDIKLGWGYRIDLLVENEIVVELKSVDEIIPIHEAQILTYLRLSSKQVGLLLNFNVGLMVNGIKRFRS